MTVAEYIVNELEKYHVTDAFGVPGGVILKLLYAMKEKSPGFKPHLNYHEQMAGFAACGYAQIKQSLGVAYATRGPGITNMITCIAEAYQQSIPVLFITAHGHRSEAMLKYRSSQELDLAATLNNFTKYSANVETIDEVERELKSACKIALEERKGPVFLDFSEELFSMQMIETSAIENEKKQVNDIGVTIDYIKNLIEKAHQPIILLGNGVRGIQLVEKLDSLNIPILSSRFSQDIASRCGLYFGYIGSHGCRYSNFILSKADVIICIGNSMSFPLNSQSFGPITNRAKIVRVDVDEQEFDKEIPTYFNVLCEAGVFLEKFLSIDLHYSHEKDWIEKCREIKRILNKSDLVEPVEKLVEVLGFINDDVVYVCDVGNNEFWFSRAFEYVRPQGQILYSQAYGTLGSSLGRAIGAYYATHKNIVCVIGDQGMQYNIQELQYIANWKLPIKIVLMNNICSGMIYDHENNMFNNQYVHVTRDTGYSVPGFKKVVEAYDIVHYYDSNDSRGMIAELLKNDIPIVYEINYSNNIRLIPNIPKGNPCQQMTPLLDKKLNDYLESL